MAEEVPLKPKYTGRFEAAAAEIKTSDRIQSIDLLKGLVIVLMALDHVRDFFHFDSFFYSPTDLAQTSVPVFMTRFVTHFCAPIFCLLAGTSAIVVGQRRTRLSLSRWLLERGFVLVLFEFTIVKFAWYFNADYSFIDLSVIWSLGISMIVLAGLIHLPKTFSIAIALIVVFGHNLLDAYRPEPTTFLKALWNVLHIENVVAINGFTVIIVYPVLPWIGVMTLGYFLGQVYLSNYGARKRGRFLISAGLALISLFILFRISNIYGDLHPWEAQSSKIFTGLSILNVTKYPPSFSFICITIGPALLFLAATERVKNRFTEFLVTFGQVPMFFYIFHLYFIHALAVPAVVLTGYESSDMVLTNWIANSTQLKGYGFSLPYVYLIWLGIVLASYPVCKWYRDYKIVNKHKRWLSYI